MNIFATAVLLVSIIAHGSFIAFARADNCTAQPFAILDTCGGVCDAYQPCLAYNTSDTFDCPNCEPDANDVCMYFCFILNYQSSGDYTVTLLIKYGTYHSDKERYERNQDPDFDKRVDATPDETSLYAWVSNLYLHNITSLALENDTRGVTIVGGTATNYGVKSKVVDVDLATDLFVNTTNLTKVQFRNMNLKERVNGLPTLLPTTVTTLDLTNTLLESFPTELASVPSLTELNLNHNYIVNISVNDAIYSLTHLSIVDNGLTAFDAYFPKLTTLNLTLNELTEIPLVVFKHSGLQTLSMTGNPLTKPEFTSSQVEFLVGLTSLDLTPASFASELDCDISQQTEVHNLTVCITDRPVPVDTNTGLIIGISAGAGGIVVASVIAFFFWLRKRNKNETSKSTTISAYSDFEAADKAHQAKVSKKKWPNALSLWTDQEMQALQVRAEEIQDVMKIGNGAFGAVWLIKYRDTLLASKRIVKEHMTKERTLEFVEEIKLVSKLDHPNIIRLIGVAWTMESDLQALFEYMKNGDLREYLTDSNTVCEWSLEKLQIMIDIIEALVYVHSFQPPLVHRDLKSRNVLLSGDMRAKLTDFGVARFRSQTNTMTIGIGTSRWLAPEVLSSTNYGPAADIYSFGVVLSELDTHRVPYADARTSSGQPLTDVMILHMVAAGTLRPTFRGACPHEVLELADRCLSRDPQARPNAAQIAYTLRMIQKRHTY